MGRRPKILLADDVDFFIELEREFLKRTPADLLICTDGRDALDITCREKPNLVYLDTDMPLLDGLTVLRAIRSDPYLSMTPIILIFPDKRASNAQFARQAGATGQLGKPLERDTFLGLGHRHLFAIDRREQRYPLQIAVHFRIANEERHGVSCDISPGGIYVHYRHPIRAEEAIRLSFCLPQLSAMIETEGRIAWVNQGAPRKHLAMPQGFGVQFQQIDREAVSRVNTYIGWQVNHFSTTFQ